MKITKKKTRKYKTKQLKKIVKKRTVKKKAAKNIKILSPSHSHQWINCAGSLQLKQDPFKSFNEATEQGNFIHYLAEYLLNKYGKLVIKDFCKVYDKIGYDESLQIVISQVASEYNSNNVYGKDFLEECLKQCLFYLEELNLLNAVVNSSRDVFSHFLKNQKVGKTIFIEDKSIFKIKTGFEFSGTKDCTEITKEDNQLYIKIIDLKTGWQPVLADENPQLKIYGAMVCFEINKLIKKYKLDLEIVEIELKIIQPSLLNTDSFFPDVNFYQDNKKIQNYFQNLSNDVKKNLNNKKKLNTGSHCRYCNSKDVCPEFKKRLREFLKPEFQELTIDRIGVWSELLEMVGSVKTLAQDLNSMAKRYMDLGQEIPGYDIERRNGKRVYKNIAEAENIIKDLIRGKKNIKYKDLLKTELMSVPELEKLLTRLGIASKKDLEVLCYQPMTTLLKKVK